MKIHLCCGAIYLDSYLNCDINGKLSKDCTEEEIEINRTDLAHYFKYPWEPDPNKRIRREFIIDIQMNILADWPWRNESIDEIVMISAFEHFEYRDEIPHIVREAYRVLKFGGVWKFDFPDIKKQVDKWYGKNDEFLAELIYCNRKNKFSEHKWMYTENTIKNHIGFNSWEFKFGDIVKHDYDMIGVTAKKR